MSLPSGYKKLEYIQSTGTQYIDTLVNIEANKPITLRVVCDCSFNNAGVGNGVGTTISGNIFYFGTYNGSYCYGLGKVDGVTSVAADTERRIHDLDAVGKKLTISGKLSLTGLSFATPTASRTFWLPQWVVGHPYVVDERLQYNGVLYRVVQVHTSQADWTPDKTPALFVSVSLDEWPEFVQPTGAHDAYNKGDKVTLEGKHYISLIDGNVYSPAAYPAGWQEQT